MTLTEEDKNWILEMLGRVQKQPDSSAGAQLRSSKRIRDELSNGLTTSIDQATKTGEQVLVGGVKLAGLGLSVAARLTQVTTRALGAGVDRYVDELGDAMMNRSKRGEHSFPLT